MHNVLGIPVFKYIRDVCSRDRGASGAPGVTRVKPREETDIPMWEGILTKQPASLKMNSGQEVTENKQVTTTA